MNVIWHYNIMIYLNIVIKRWNLFDMLLNNSSQLI